MWTQLACNIKRACLSTIRRKSDLRSRVVRSIYTTVILMNEIASEKGLFTSVMLSTSFLFLDTDQKGAAGRPAVLFFVLVTAATTGGAVIPSVVQERAIFYREQASGAYRSVTYPA